MTLILVYLILMIGMVWCNYWRSFRIMRIVVHLAKAQKIAKSYYLRYR